MAGKITYWTLSRTHLHPLITLLLFLSAQATATTTDQNFETETASQTASLFTEQITDIVTGEITTTQTTISVAQTTVAQTTVATANDPTDGESTEATHTFSYLPTTFNDKETSSQATPTMSLTTETALQTASLLHEQTTGTLTGEATISVAQTTAAQTTVATDSETASEFYEQTAQRTPAETTQTAPPEMTQITTAFNEQITHTTTTIVPEITVATASDTTPPHQEQTTAETTAPLQEQTTQAKATTAFQELTTQITTTTSSLLQEQTAQTTITPPLHEQPSQTTITSLYEQITTRGSPVEDTTTGIKTSDETTLEPDEEKTEMEIMETTVVETAATAAADSTREIMTAFTDTDQTTDLDDIGTVTTKESIMTTSVVSSTSKATPRPALPSWKTPTLDSQITVLIPLALRFSSSNGTEISSLNDTDRFRTEIESLLTDIFEECPGFVQSIVRNVSFDESKPVTLLKADDWIYAQFDLSIDILISMREVNVFILGPAMNRLLGADIMEGEWKVDEDFTSTNLPTALQKFIDEFSNANCAPAVATACEKTRDCYSACAVEPTTISQTCLFSGCEKPRVCSIKNDFESSCVCGAKYLPVSGDRCVHENVVIGLTTGIVGAVLILLLVITIILYKRQRALRSKKRVPMLYDSPATFSQQSRVGYGGGGQATGAHGGGEVRGAHGREAAFNRSNDMELSSSSYMRKNISEPPTPAPRAASAGATAAAAETKVAYAKPRQIERAVDVDNNDMNVANGNRKPTTGGVRGKTTTIKEGSSSGSTS